MPDDSASPAKASRVEMVLNFFLKRFSTLLFKYNPDTDTLKVGSRLVGSRLVGRCYPRFAAEAVPGDDPLSPGLGVLAQYINFIAANPPEGIFEGADEKTGMFRLYYRHTADGIIGFLSDLDAELAIRREPIDVTGCSPITKLPTLPAAEQLVDAAIRRLDIGEKGVFFLFDIDDFASVAAVNGQAAADNYLRQLAGVLRADFRSGDVIGQIRDDRFFVFFTGRFTIDVIEQRAQHLVSLLRKVRSEAISSLSSYLGIAVSGSQGATYASLYPRAHKALEVAKRRGKNRYCMYDE